ncbi:MAG: DNA recombination protein RmuC [Myxococcales bacterium]
MEGANGLSVVAALLGGAAASAIAGVVCWTLAAARTRAAAQRTLGEAEARALAAGATTNELRGQVVALQRRIAESDAELRRLDAERAAGGARVAEMERAVEEQWRLLEDAKGQLTATFQALAAETLHKNNEGFLQLATEKLAAARREGTDDLAARAQAIAALVTPVRQSLEKFDLQVHALERARGEAYVKLTEQVRALSEGQRQLQSGTDNLVNALRAPAVRGRWGEIQLRRVMELAGMMEHCDFTEQETVRGGDGGRLRPDVIVRLPGDKRVVVDAKAPLAAFLAAQHAGSDEERRAHLKHHAEQVRAHVVKLGGKHYWDEIAGSPELVVMFLPGDAFYAAALEHLPGLLEEAVAHRVLIATPMTLIAVLQAVHVGWKQDRLAAGAEEISRCGRDLHERISTLAEHLARMGAALGRTVDAFNGVAGCFETRVLPTARRLEDLGAAGKKELTDVDPVDTRPRAPLSAVAAEITAFLDAPGGGGRGRGDDPLSTA